MRGCWRCWRWKKRGSDGVAEEWIEERGGDEEWEGGVRSDERGGGGVNGRWNGVGESGSLKDLIFSSAFGDVFAT
jgi:hypothetical protein